MIILFYCKKKYSLKCNSKYPFKCHEMRLNFLKHSRRITNKF